MKKALFGVLVFLLYMSSPLALWKTSDFTNCISNKECLLVCSYNIYEDAATSVNYKNKTLNVYYRDGGQFNRNIFVIEYPNGDIIEPTTFNNLFRSDDRFFYSSSYYDKGVRKERDYDSFTCPKSLMLDTQVSPWMLCFADDLNYCLTVKYRDFVRSTVVKSDVFFSNETRFASSSRSVIPPSKKASVDISIGEDIKSHVKQALSSTLKSVVDEFILNNKDNLDGMSDTNKNKKLTDLLTEKMLDILYDIYLNDLKNMTRETIPEFFRHHIDQLFQSEDINGQFESALRDLKHVAKSLLERGKITQEEYDAIVEVADHMEENSEEIILSLGKKLDDALKVALKEVIQTCDSIFGHVKNKEKPAYWIQLFLNIIRITGIAALLLLSAMDFFKATVAQDSDAMKKASATSLKRLIYTIVLFFLPILIEFLFKVLHLYDAIDMCKDVIS